METPGSNLAADLKMSRRFEMQRLSFRRTALSMWDRSRGMQALIWNVMA
jgi:hypothetical protein